MATNKKYDLRVVQDAEQWSAQIIRRITTKKTVVSKSETGFATEADAQAWGQAELKTFVQSLEARNKRRSKPRKVDE